MSSSPAHFLVRLFVFLILSYMSCLYILEINPLSVVSFANIFSISEGYLFILFMASFAVWKIYVLIRCHLFIFVYFYYSRRWIKKDIAVIYDKECSMFSFSSFIVSSLIFRSLIHFEFIFLYGDRKCSNFILLQVVIQFSQHYLFFIYIYF